MEDVRRTLTREQRAKVESALGQSGCPSFLAQCHGVSAPDYLSADLLGNLFPAASEPHPSPSLGPNTASYSPAEGKSALAPPDIEKDSTADDNQ